MVDGIVQWVQDQQQTRTFLPASPFSKALDYLNSRMVELRVFLSNPEVPLDTNHVERAIRPIPMGRKNWLFCWTELGAEHVAVPLRQDSCTIIPEIHSGAVGATKCHVIQPKENTLY